MAVGEGYIALGGANGWVAVIDIANDRYGSSPALAEAALSAVGDVGALTLDLSWCCS
jgi:hypothetical protein